MEAAAELLLFFLAVCKEQYTLYWEESFFNYHVNNCVKWEKSSSY